MLGTILFLGLLAGSWCEPPKLQTIYSWKALEFAFPNERAREVAINDGTFIPGAPVPLDMDVFYGGSKERALLSTSELIRKQGSIVFVTIPRLQDGVPVTLGYVTNEVTSEGNPIIAPYPSWEWQKSDDCNSIISVFRIQIDQCNRLWVLDTGKVGERQICSPQIHVFSLATNKLVHRYRFPKEQYTDVSLFVTIAVDIRNMDYKCRDTYAYIADVTGFSLLVYDHRNNRSWKIVNNLFYPYPPYGSFDIKGSKFDLMDGLIGLALGPVKETGDRILYFHSLASRVESWVPTSIIRNDTLFSHTAEASPRSFIPFALERSSQSAAEVMNKDGVLFFGLLSDLAIGCWNSNSYPEYGGKNVEKLVVDPENLQFPSGMKLAVTRRDQEQLWIFTSSFQKFMVGSLEPTETNFRIVAGFVEELVRGTKCDVKSVGHVHGPVTFPK